MKTLLILLMVVPGLVSAQVDKAFDGNNPDIYKNIADIIIKGSGVPFSLLQADSAANGDYTTTYRSAGNDTLTLVVHHSTVGKPPADLYSITSITAPFAVLFPFWKTHFEPEAKEAALIAFQHGIAYSLKKPGGHEKIFSFGKLEDNSNWRIRAKDW